MSWESETEEKGYNKRLVSLMHARNISEERLAVIAGISSRQVWNIIHGKSSPRMDTVLRICRALHTTPDYLYPMRPVAAVGSDRLFSGRVRRTPLLSDGER